MLKKLFAAAALAAVSVAASAAGTKQYSGTVDSVQGRKVHMTLRDKSTGDWTVAENAPVIFGKEHLKLEDVKPGWRANVVVSEDGVIHKFQVTARPKGTAGSKGPAKGGTAMWGEKSKNGKDRWWRGEIVKVDEAKKEIQIQRQGGKETTHFRADAKTNVIRAGHPPQKIAFSELKTGQMVEAVAGGGKTVEIAVMEGGK